MRLMSTRARGAVTRSFMAGIKLCPPAKTFASPSKRPKIATASSRLAGAKYSKDAGYTAAPPLIGYGSHPEGPGNALTRVAGPDTTTAVAALFSRCRASVGALPKAVPRPVSCAALAVRDTLGELSEGDLGPSALLRSEPDRRGRPAEDPGA